MSLCRRLFISVFTVFLLLTALAAQAQMPGGTMKPTVVAVRVVEEEVGRQLQRVGRVQAVEKIELKTRVEGFLEKRLFEEGGRVKKGELLYLIERAPYRIMVDKRRAELTGAEASYINASAALKRTRELRKKGVASQASLDNAINEEVNAKVALMQARANMEEAELDLSYTEIRSPIDGQISMSNFSVGNLVKPDSGTLATVTSVDPIYVTLSVSERNLLEVRREGLHDEKKPFFARLQLSDGSIYDHAGEFDFLGTEVSQTTDTITVRATFPNPDGLLLPGQFVHVLVEEREKQKRLLIPQATVQQDRQGYFVLVITDDNQVQQRRIQIAGAQGTNYIVSSGLAREERIILEGLQKVRSGMEVNVVEQ
ncbi:efflux RND transporter periplasmic adaptor subunit [Emcibacter nanhaiensis]|uniref:Efflux RND transporter periplasmic adaptor subunit n=1 Tax=Emcibacter nanhaiensis TaxID=1505037 RepID=A0A501PI75_9PROT|nr:efflux RND transporter periplasmic adaptor subunit [Emcibacter nanhaiensis]TPD59807.1 efflux RND transporter periplasmic adaptor subunit [Emcibacter nanhaiensis]